jgi:hypothetical protein
MPIRFDEVLLADGMAWALFGLAQKEGLLYTSNGESFPGHYLKSKDRQAVLSLIILFDKLVVHDLSPNSGTFRLPDLEKSGVLEIVATDEPLTKPAPIKSSWKPSKFDPRQKPPVSLRQNLALIREYEPLVIDRLMSVASKFDSSVANGLHISRRAYLHEFFDLATNYLAGNTKLLRQNVLEQTLPSDLLKTIKCELFDFTKNGEVLSPTNVTLLMSLIFANEIQLIKELSSARGLGVATRHYTRMGRASFQNDFGFSTDPSRIPRTFGLVRSILNEEGHFFPEIENIAHALKLRNNPNLRAFREQFREFHVQLARGDNEAIQGVRREVKQAKRAIERIGKWNLGLRWLTYISLPASVAESLLSGLPIVGTSLAVMSVAGTVATAHASRKNQWVMFGM